MNIETREIPRFARNDNSRDLECWAIGEAAI